MRSVSLYLAWAVLLALASAGYAAVVDPGAPSGAAAGSGQLSPRVATSGTGGLYPGASGVIRLKVRNRSSQPVTIRAIRTRVGDATPACTSENLIAPTQQPLHQRIRPHKNRQISIGVTMPRSAGDACQGVTFPLQFQAKVTP